MRQSFKSVSKAPDTWGGKGESEHASFQNQVVPRLSVSRQTVRYVGSAELVVHRHTVIRIEPESESIIPCDSSRRIRLSVWNGTIGIRMCLQDKDFTLPRTYLAH